MTSAETPKATSDVSEPLSKMLDWIEKQALESLKARFATAELLAKETQTTLTVMLAGVAGSAAYGAKIFEPGAQGPVVIASGIVCAYLVLLCIWLAIKCMRFESYPALYQDPMNLLQPSVPLDDIREAELKNIEDRIQEAKKINDHRAKWLNLARIATAASPVIFAIAALSAPKAELPKPQKATVLCKIMQPLPNEFPTLKCDLQN